MFYANNCGGCCEPGEFNWSKADRKALLKEKAAVLGAKLATVRHWIETVDAEKDGSDKQ